MSLEINPEPFSRGTVGCDNGKLDVQIGMNIKILFGRCSTGFRVKEGKTSSWEVAAYDIFDLIFQTIAAQEWDE